MMERVDTVGCPVIELLWALAVDQVLFERMGLDVASCLSCTRCDQCDALDESSVSDLCLYGCPVLFQAFVELIISCCWCFLHRV